MSVLRGLGKVVALDVQTLLEVEFGWKCCGLAVDGSQD